MNILCGKPLQCTASSTCEGLNYLAPISLRQTSTTSYRTVSPWRLRSPRRLGCIGAAPERSGIDAVGIEGEHPIVEIPSSGHRPWRAAYVLARPKKAFEIQYES